LFGTVQYCTVAHELTNETASGSLTAGPALGRARRRPVIVTVKVHCRALILYSLPSVLEELTSSSAKRDDPCKKHWHRLLRDAVGLGLGSLCVNHNVSLKILGNGVANVNDGNREAERGAVMREWVE
jgi:hypothetical protein